MKGVLALITVAVALVLLLVPAPPVKENLADPPGVKDRIAPRVLASWIISDAPHYHLLDVRSTDRFLENGIRTAESVPTDSLDDRTIRSIPSGHMIVLYGDTDDDVVAAFRRVKALHEQTFVLAGGRTACEREVLTPPEAPTGNDEAAWEDYRARVAVHNYLTGKSDAPPEPVKRTVNPVSRSRIKVKNEGC